MVKQMRVPRGLNDSYVSLEEQLRFIHSSGMAFDRGDESEAKRISSALRIIWKTASLPAASKNLTRKERKSHSRRTVGLATQIGFKEMLIDTSVEVPNSNGDRRLIAWTGARPTPLFAGLTRRLVSFDDWWSGTAIQANDRYYSRKKVVLAMCEMDGGVHVDEDLADWYHGITRLGNFGTQLIPSGDGKTLMPKPLASPIGAIVRQIGHETLMTFDKSYTYDGTKNYGGGTSIVFAQATIRPNPDKNGNQPLDEIHKII